MFTAVYGGLQMTQEWNKVVSLTKKGAGLAFSTDGKILAVYCSQTSSPASIVIFDVTNGAIINHFNYNNIKNDVDFKNRLMVVGKSPTDPTQYNIYGYYGVTVGGSYLFGFQISLATPGPATQVFSLKSASGSSENRYGLLLSSDESRLYLYGANFGDYVIGSAMAATGSFLWGY